MEEKLKDLISTFAQKALGKKADEVLPLLTEEKIGEAIDTLLVWDSQRVEGFKKREADAFERAYKKANAEIMSGFETKFKEKFQFESSKTGLELIEDYIKSIEGSKQITDEQVKSHPAYVALEKSIKNVEKRINDEWQQKYNNLIAEQKRKEVLSHVMKEASTLLEELNPVLPDEPKLRNNQLSWFNKELESMNYEVRENPGGQPTIFILDKDNNRLENQHGSPKDFKEFVSEIAGKYWMFNKTQKRSAHLPEQKGSEKVEKTWQSKIQLRKPANRQEAEKMLQEIQNNAELSKSEKIEAQVALADLMNGTIN